MLDRREKYGIFILKPEILAMVIKGYRSGIFNQSIREREENALRSPCIYFYSAGKTLFFCLVLIALFNLGVTQWLCVSAWLPHHRIEQIFEF